jgi:hypothetical protein
MEKNPGTVVESGQISSTIERPDPIVTWNENLLKNTQNKETLKSFLNKFKDQISNAEKILSYL